MLGEGLSETTDTLALNALPPPLDPDPGAENADAREAPRAL
jgi:hypothetical protein